MNKVETYRLNARKLIPFTAGALASVGTAVGTPVLNPSNGHHYDIIDVSGGISWGDARVAAAASMHSGRAGHLATITSQAESDFLAAAFPMIVVGQNIGGYMLGGYQADTTGGPADGWAWVTGEAWSYTNWLPGGEPNDFQGVPENYLGIHDYLGPNPNMYWNDLAGFSNGYIVEYEAAEVPEAGPALALFASGLAGMSCLRRRQAS